MHWMTSGRGIVHEEVPELKGRPARGLQIFVNLAAANKFMEPGYVFAEAMKSGFWRRMARPSAPCWGIQWHRLPGEGADAGAAD